MDYFGQIISNEISRLSDRQWVFSCAFLVRLQLRFKLGEWRIIEAGLSGCYWLNEVCMISVIPVKSADFSLASEWLIADQLNHTKCLSMGCSVLLFFWMFEALQRRKQLQRPHQTQHSAPPESGGGPARLPTVPGQGPQSARTGNRPPPNMLPPYPGPGTLPLMGVKVAAGSSPSTSSLSKLLLCSHGEVERSFCSLASPCKNTTRPLPHVCCTINPKEKVQQGKSFRLEPARVS